MFKAFDDTVFMISKFNLKDEIMRLKLERKVIMSLFCLSFLGCKMNTHVSTSNIENQISKTANTANVSKVKRIIPEYAEPLNETQPVEYTNGAMVHVTEYRLKIPNNIQETGYYCVPACLQMVLEYHGIETSQEQLANEMNTSSVTGTEYADLSRVANKYIFNNEDEDPSGVGYHVQTIKRGDSTQAIYDQLEERIRQDIKTNDPVFIAIDIRTIYPDFSWTANHMVVCTGYTTYEGTDNIAYYYIVDPSYLVQDDIYGGLKTVTKEELYEAIYTNEEPAYIW